MSNWIKLCRTPQTYELLADKNAFVLFTVICLRARRTDSSDLKTGQAFIGDYAEYGLSEQQYRTAKLNVQKRQLATFKATPRGTIATLVDKTIYDINSDDGQHPVQRPDNVQTNAQITTNKNEKKDYKNEKNIYAHSFGNKKLFKGANDVHGRIHRSDTEYRHAEQCADCIRI